MSGAVRQPAYSFHKATGQARVTINRRDIYLGPHNSPAESLDRYSDVIAEWRIRKPSERCEPRGKVEGRRVCSGERSAVDDRRAG
jgi:hypothetical protein